MGLRNKEELWPRHRFKEAVVPGGIGAAIMLRDVGEADVLSTWVLRPSHRPGWIAEWLGWTWE